MLEQEEKLKARIRRLVDEKSVRKSLLLFLLPEKMKESFLGEIEGRCSD